jgi:heme/copper-type cytochrome/quinol oxidase subunit 1
MLKLLFHHFLIGAVAAIAFGGLVLWTDLAGIATLIANSSVGELALVLLFVGLISTFGPIAMLFALMGSDDETRAGRRGDGPPPQ